MPPTYVKAYLKRSKNDANDAEAICEAVTRPSMRFVPIKTKEQQAASMLHRTRQLLVRPTSPCCPSAWQPNPGRRSTYRRGKSVRTTGTTSDSGGVGRSRISMAARRPVTAGPYDASLSRMRYRGAWSHHEAHPWRASSPVLSVLVSECQTIERGRAFDKNGP